MNTMIDDKNIGNKFDKNLRQCYIYIWAYILRCLSQSIGTI